MVTFFSSIILGLIFSPFGSVIAPIFFSLGIVIITFYFIQNAENKSQIVGNGWVLGGAIAGFVILLFIFQNMFSSFPILHIYSGKELIHTAEDQSDLQELLVDNLSNTRHEDLKIEIVDSLPILRNVCKIDIVNKLCRKTPFNVTTRNKETFKNKTLSVSGTDTNTNNISDQIFLVEENERIKFYAGTLKSEELLNAGFTKLDDQQAIVNGLNEILEKNGADDPILKTIREACLIGKVEIQEGQRKTEPFCNFPIYEVLIQRIKKDQKNNAEICFSNSVFKNYGGLTVELSLKKKDVIETSKNVKREYLVSPVSVILKDTLGFTIEEPCVGDRIDKLIRISDAKFEELLAGLKNENNQEFLAELKDEELVDAYAGYARIRPSELIYTTPFASNN